MKNRLIIATEELVLFKYKSQFLDVVVTRSLRVYVPGPYLNILARLEIYAKN